LVLIIRINITGNNIKKASGLIAHATPIHFAKPVPPLNLKKIGKKVPNKIKHGKITVINSSIFLVKNIQVVKIANPVKTSPKKTKNPPDKPNSLEKLAVPGLLVPNSIISFL
jgi:hypothetical protein